MTGFVHRHGPAFHGPRGIRFRRIQPGAWTLETATGVVARDLATMDDALAAGSRLVRCADEAARLLDVGPRDLGNEEAVLDLAVLLFRAGTADAALAAATSMALTPSVLHALRQRPHSPLARARAA